MEFWIKILWDTVIEHSNSTTSVLALFGLLGAGALGAWVKRPLILQSLKNNEFKTQLDGIKVLNEILNGMNMVLTKRNVFLESQIAIKEEYEALLVKRLRECEERHLRLIEDKGDGHSTC